nr:HIT domain-containing protein [Candidatus Freyarchaeota archaeon]
MTECLFCKIFRGEVESRKVYEDDTNIAILDINPRMHECQVLVIPKTHVEQFYELNDEELASLFKAVKEVALIIKKPTIRNSFHSSAEEWVLPTPTL